MMTLDDAIKQAFSALYEEEEYLEKDSALWCAMQVLKKYVGWIDDPEDPEEEEVTMNHDRDYRAELIETFEEFVQATFPTFDTPGDIKEFLDLYEVDSLHLAQMRRLRERVVERIEELEMQREAIEQTVGELIEIERQASERLQQAR